MILKEKIKELKNYAVKVLVNYDLASSLRDIERLLENGDFEKAESQIISLIDRLDRDKYRFVHDSLNQMLRKKKLKQLLR